MSAVAFPNIQIESLEMRMDAFVSRTTSVGGKIFSTQRGRPKWRATLQTVPLTRSQSQELEAWWTDQLVGMNTTLLSNAEKAYPVRYPNGFAGLTRATGGAFDGTATTSSLTPTTIGLQGLPANFVLEAGDLVGLEEAGRYGLFQLKSAATAIASGTLTIDVHPQINTTAFSLAATANFASPLLEMVVDPGSFQGPRTARPQPVRFSLSQVSY